MSEAMSLERAARLIESGKRERALVELLLAWEKSRAVEIGDAIVALGVVCAFGKVPPDGKRAKDVFAAWVERAAVNDVAELSLLLESLTAGSSQQSLARLDALGQHVADPRIGRALAALVASPPFQALSTKPFWKSLFFTLPTHADARCKAVLEKKRGTMLETLNGATGMADWLEKQIEKVLEHIADAPALSAKDRERIARIDVAIAKARPVALLLADLKIDLADEAKHEAARETLRVLAHRAFEGSAALPLRLLEELDATQRAVVATFVEEKMGGLEGVGLFNRAESLARFMGANGALDERMMIGAKELPVWWAFAHAAHGRLPREIFLDAIRTLAAPAIAAAWVEIVSGVYELSRGRGHADDDGDEFARQRLHHERVALLLAEMSLLAKEHGRVAAEAVARVELDSPDTHSNGAKRLKHGLKCVYSACSLLAHAKARGQVLSSKWDALVAESIEAPPAQRAPAVTESILKALPVERASAIVIEAAPVYRIGASRTARTIFFDDTLRFLDIAKSAETAARVVDAIEAWARIRDETPKGAPPPDALPKKELVDHLAAVGEPARARLEASLAKDHGAKKIIEEAIRKLDARRS